MIKAYKYNFVFDSPVKIASKTFHNNQGILVNLDNGSGEAVPDPIVTKDDQESVFDYLRNCNPDTESIEELHKSLPHGSPTARAALDFAYHDLLGKKENKQVCDLYKGNINNPGNCITIFGHTPEETKKVAEEILDAYPHLQIIKIKLMGDGDFERCRTIKEVADSKKRNVSYLVDCNQGYKTAAEAIEMLKKLKELLKNIVLCEEPVPAREWDMLKQVTDNQDIPVFADESAVGMEDVNKIIEKNCCSGINIKLQKTGGIWPAKKIAKRCQEAGLKVMVGCMLESSIGISAGIHFARSTENVVVTDLDYDLALPDVYKKMPPFEDGERIPTGDNGLGVEIDYQKIDNLRKKNKLIFEQIIP